MSLRTPAQHGSQTFELDDDDELSKELEQISELTLSEQLKELELSHSEDDQLSELKSQLEELEENSVQSEEDELELELEEGAGQLDELELLDE